MVDGNGGEIWSNGVSDVGLNKNVSREMGDKINTVSKAPGTCSDDVRRNPVTSKIRKKIVMYVDKVRTEK